MSAQTNRDTEFYFCPTCFEVSATLPDNHVHHMVLVNAGRSGDERRKPLIDADGRVQSRAPRWYLEAWQAIEPYRKEANDRVLTL